MTAREEVLRTVRRARVRLEAVRLLEGAARGALAGGGAGLLALLAMKAVPGWPVLPAVAWSLLGAGALSGLLHALMLGSRIGAAAAALFLDRRLKTQERFVTVLACAPGPYTDRLAAELLGACRLPRIPLPREAALAPVALFLLFAAGLLPEAGAAPAETGAPELVRVESTDVGGKTVEVDDETLAKLAKGRPPEPGEAAKVEDAIEQRLHRPEDRNAAREALEKAMRGDASSARDVARALADKKEEKTGAVIRGSAYPEAEEFVRRYRRALSKE